MLALSKRVSLDEASSKATKPKPRDSKILVTPWEAEDPDHYASSKFIDFLDSKMRNVEHPNKNNIAFHESLSPIPDIESYTQMLAEPIQSEQTPIENERKSFSRRRMVEEAFSKGKDSSMATTVNFNKKRIGRDDVNVQNLTMPSKIYVNAKENINSNFQGREGSQQAKESFDQGMVSSNRSYKENGNISSAKRPATVLAGTIGSNESIDQDNGLEYDKVIEDELKVSNGTRPVTQKSRTISRLGNRNLYRRNFCGEGISLEGENNKSLFAFWNKERKNSRSHLKSGDQGRPSLEILDKTTEGTTGLKSRIREVVERQTFSGKFLLTNTPTRTPKSITNQSITKTKDNRSPTKMRKLKALNEPNIRIRTSEKDLTEAGTSNTEVSLPVLEETPTHHYKTLSNVGCKDLSQITLPTSDATSPSNQTSMVGGIGRPSTTKAQSESRKVLEGGFGQYLETVMETEGMKSDIANSIKLTNKIWRRHKNKYNDKEQVPVVSSAKRAEEEKPEVVKKIEKKLKKRIYDRNTKNSKGTPIEVSLKVSRNERKVGLEKRQGLSLNISEMNNSKPWHRLYPIETTKSFYMNRTLRPREYLGENGTKSTLNQTQSKVNDRPVSRLRNTVKGDGETKISFAQTQINFSTILHRRDSEGTKSVRRARAKKEL